MSRIVVLVNNEYWNDSRVMRTVSVLGRIFPTVTVLCGVTERAYPVREQSGNVQIIRHFFLKPTCSQSRFMRFISGLFARDRHEVEASAHIASRVRRLIMGISLIFVYLGWFLYIVIANLFLAFRYRNTGASVYFSNDFDTLPAGFLLAKIHRARLVYDAHELYSDILESFPGSFRCAVRFLEGTIARRADSIVTVNDSIAGIMRDRYSLRETPVTILNCPCYQQIEEQLRPYHGPLRMIYHGYLLPGRNLDILLQSMPFIHNARLHIRGRGVLETELRLLADRLGLQEKVRFLDLVPPGDLVASGSAFDIGILPCQGTIKNLNSWYCAPNKVFEYMMSGLALAVGNTPEMSRIVGDWGNGFVFDATDPESLAEVVNGLAGETIVRMRQRSLDAAREVFNFEKESEKLFDLFSRLTFDSQRQEKKGP